MTFFRNPTHFSQFQSIPDHSSQFQIISGHSNPVQSIPVHTSQFQPKPSLSIPAQPIPVTSLHKPASGTHTKHVYLPLKHLPGALPWLTAFSPPHLHPASASPPPCYSLPFLTNPYCSPSPASLPPHVIPNLATIYLPSLAPLFPINCIPSPSLPHLVTPYHPSLIPLFPSQHPSPPPLFPTFPFSTSPH